MIDRLLRGLSNDDLNEFHEKVLYLIENVGIQLKHKEMLRRLSDFHGVVINKDIVTFGSDLVNQYVFNIKFDMPEYFSDDNFTLITGTMSPTIRDGDTGKIRFATSQDLKSATKLEDSFDVTGTAAVGLSDVPKHLREILSHKILWENSRFKGNDIFEHNARSTISCCKYIEEMAQVLNKRFTVGAWIQSPRTFNNFELDVVYHYLDKNVPLWVGNFPMYGVTSPIFIEASMVQAAAELFSGYLILKLLHGDYPVYLQVIDSIMGHPINWKFTNVTLSSIEDILKTIYQISIDKYYNIPIVGMTLLSGGKEIDCQVGFEKGIHTLIASLLGARAFRIGGLVALDMVYSPEQLVVDYEILQFIKRLMDREYFDREKIVVDEIAKVEPGGSYLASELTYEHFRKEYQEFSLFDSTPVDHWLEKGAISVESRAHEIVKERIRRHECELTSDQQREIDRIYRRATRDGELADSFEGR